MTLGWIMALVTVALCILVSYRSPSPAFFLFPILPGVITAACFGLAMMSRRKGTKSIDRRLEIILAHPVNSAALDGAEIGFLIWLPIFLFVKPASPMLALFLCVAGGAAAGATFGIIALRPR